MKFAAVILVGAFLATAAGYRAIASEHTRQCNVLSVPQCQGLGYTLTPLSDDEQATLSEEMSALLMLDGIYNNAVHRAFLCYSLAPKCRRRESYDVRPCREACEQVFEDITDSETIGILRGWDESLNCDSSSLFSRTQDDFLCVKYKKLVTYAQASGSDSGSYNPDGFDLTDLGNSLSDMSSSLAGLGVDGDTSMSSFGAPGMGNMSLSEYLSATQEMATLFQSIGDGSGPDSAENMSRMVELAKAMGIEVPDMSNGMPNMAMSGMPDSGSMPAGFDMSGFSQGNPYDLANEGGK